MPHTSDNERFAPPIFAAPACAKCGQPMRLTRIEPHERFTNLDDRHFDCACGAVASFAVIRSD